MAEKLVVVERLFWQLGGGGDALVAVAVIERWPLVEARMYFDGTNPITGKGIQL